MQESLARVFIIQLLLLLAEDASQLLQKALEGDRAAQSTLYTASRSYLPRQVSRIAPYLAPGRREDVVHQAWLDLLNKGPDAFRSAWRLV